MIPRQLVNQPAVNRTQAEFPVCSTFLSFFSTVSKQPCHLCSRKISRKLQTRRLADLLCVPLLRNLLRNAACAAALPYNSTSSAERFIPDYIEKVPAFPDFLPPGHAGTWHTRTCGSLQFPAGYHIHR